RHPWRTVAVWGLVLLVAVGLMGAFLNTATTTTADTTSNPDSKIGRELLEDRLRGPERADESIVVHSDILNVDDPQFRAVVEDVFGQVSALGPEVVESTTTYYQSGNEALVSQDRRTTVIPVRMAGELDDAAINVEDIVTIAEEAREASDFE